MSGSPSGGGEKPARVLRPEGVPPAASHKTTTWLGAGLDILDLVRVLIQGPRLNTPISA